VDRVPVLRDHACFRDARDFFTHIAESAYRDYPAVLIGNYTYLHNFSSRVLANHAAAKMKLNGLVASVGDGKIVNTGTVSVDLHSVKCEINLATGVVGITSTISSP
jgi:hypothetical protein